MKFALIGLGVVILAIGLVNHFAIHQNPIAHTSTIVLAVGAILLVVGVVMSFMGGTRKPSPASMTVRQASSGDALSLLAHWPIVRRCCACLTLHSRIPFHRLEQALAGWLDGRVRRGHRGMYTPCDDQHKGNRADDVG